MKLKLNFMKLPFLAAKMEYEIVFGLRRNSRLRAFLILIFSFYNYFTVLSKN